MKIKLRYLVAGIAIVLLVLGAGSIIRAIHQSLHAERTLHAYGLVLEVVTFHLAQNGGKWPTGWDELERVTTDAEFAGWRWTEDRGAIERRIRIDFDVETEEVVAAGAENFTAIRQVPPYYPSPYPDRIQKLLEIAAGAAE